VKKHLFLTCICLILIVSFLVPPVLAAERSSAATPVRVVDSTPAPAGVGTTAPVVRGTIIPIAAGTTTPVPEGCSCLLASEAATRFGTYIQCAETVCGYGGMDATGRQIPKYYYKAALVDVPVSIPAGVSTTAPPLRTNPVPVGAGTTYPETAVPTSALPAETSFVSVPAVSMVPIITSTPIPSITLTVYPMMQEQSAKPKTGIYEIFIGFFAGIFGGWNPSGTGNDNPGGNNEPAGDLPPGLKPVSQVTTHVPQGEMPHDITVTSPKAGDEVLVTVPIKVTWVMPDNPSGTISLKLVRYDGGQFTGLGHTIVPNTGQYTWYQQDNAHDCGLPGHVDCFGPSLADLGITDMIQYANAWNLPPIMDCTIEASTDAFDPYPAFHGSSGTFRIKNPYAFFDTDVTGNTVGYANTKTGFDADSPYMHTVYRMVITPDLTGLYQNQKIKKATLTLLRGTTRVGMADGTEHQDNSRSSIASVWILSGTYPGQKPAAQTPIVFNYPAPATGGSTGHVSFDSASGLVTIDMTEGLNLWLSDNTPGASPIVLVGSDESGSDTRVYQYTGYTVVSFTVER
jgi:hypothetical protein